MATSENPGRQPLSPAVRKRLQAWFEHGSKSAAKGDFKFATDMFAQCVKDDPSNVIYIKTFLTNLAKRYNDNKKGAGMLSAPKMTATKASIMKSARSKDWSQVIKTGLDGLQINPWDVSVLLSMGDASEGLKNDEAQLTYLKWALDVNSKDIEVNRRAAKTLARMGQYDQAIACWHRVEQARPGDEEAQREIGNLSVERTIDKGGYEEATSGTDVMADKAAQADRRSDANARLTPQQQLEKAIVKNPEELNNYIELAELHSREERLKDAVAVLTKALEVSGGDVNVRERLEDAQLRRGRHQLQIAEKKAAQEKTPESLDLAKRMKAELNATEIEYFRNRGERYPNNSTYKFELGVRLKKAGQYNEAINCFQKASADPKRKSLVFMELGECFQYIKQFKLAMTNYVAAVESLSDREIDQRKLALYRAGKLALGLGEKYQAAKDAQAKDELTRAEKYLNELAGLEFGYKDVPALLDKIAKIRDKG